MVSLQKLIVKLYFGLIVLYKTLLQKNTYFYIITTDNYFHKNSNF